MTVDQVLAFLLSFSSPFSKLLSKEYYFFLHDPQFPLSLYFPKFPYDLSYKSINGVNCREIKTKKMIIRVILKVAAISQATTNLKFPETESLIHHQVTPILFCCNSTDSTEEP